MKTRHIGFTSSLFGHLGSNYIVYHHDGTTQSMNAWLYTPIVIVCCVTSSLSVLYQEMKLKQSMMAKGDRPCPPELMNGWISLMLSLFTFALSPALIYLGDPETHFWSDWRLFLHHAFLCLFSGTGAGNDHGHDHDAYCPNGSSRSMLQFMLWLLCSFSVQISRDFVLHRVSPLASRFCVLFGLLCAFICFQRGFPEILLMEGGADSFDECLLLGVLCSFVGSIMLLIDFNPSRSSTLVDSIQFDDLHHLNRSKQIKSQLLTLKEQHESLSMSQSQINVLVHDENEEEIERKQRDEHEPVYTESHHQYHAQSLSVHRARSQSVHENPTTDYVCYLLMEQQKEIIKQEYETKLKEYRRAQRRRSKSLDHPFLHELYAPNIPEHDAKKAQRKRKRKKKVYMNEQQIKEYHMLLQQEHYRRKQEEVVMRTGDEDVFECSNFKIRDSNYH